MWVGGFACVCVFGGGGGGDVCTWVHPPLLAVGLGLVIVPPQALCVCEGVCVCGWVGGCG